MNENIIINNFLKRQTSFKWQEWRPYKDYPSTFDYHVYHHPVCEKNTGKWKTKKMKNLKHQKIYTPNTKLIECKTRTTKK